MQLQNNSSNNELNKLLASIGIWNFDDLCQYVKRLPYGRNSNRSDFLFVLKEKKGTCSSKHGFLKWVAESYKVKGVKLIMVIYKMNAINTPKVAIVLRKYGLDHIPEAHCYLEIRGIICDFTSENAAFDHFKDDIIERQEINEDQLMVYKVEYHRQYLKSWLMVSDVIYTFEELWNIREECIKALTTN